jgi:hypothetical protein
MGGTLAIMKAHFVNLHIMERVIKNHSAQHGEIILENDERMHPYQRGRASITGLVFELREIIETGRLVGVVMSRLVLPSFSLWRAGTSRRL